MTWDEARIQSKMDAVDNLARPYRQPFSDLYCDLCERDGHTFRTCPQRDDEEFDDY